MRKLYNEIKNQLQSYRLVALIKHTSLKCRKLTLFWTEIQAKSNIPPSLMLQCSCWLLIVHNSRSVLSVHLSFIKANQFSSMLILCSPGLARKIFMGIILYLSLHTSAKFFLKDILVYFVFSVTALLRCNSHTIQFIHLKCTILWRLALIYSQSCTTIATINLKHFHHHKKKSYTFSSHSPTPTILPIPAQSQATPNLLSVSVDLPILDVANKLNLIICGLL